MLHELIIECDGDKDAVRIGAIRAIRRIWDPADEPEICIGGRCRAWHDPSVADRTEGIQEIAIADVPMPVRKGYTWGDLARQAPAEVESLRIAAFDRGAHLVYAYAVATEHEADIIPFRDERARDAVDNAGPFEVSAVIIAPANDDPVLVDIVDFANWDSAEEREFVPWSENEPDVWWLYKPRAGNPAYKTIREAVPEAVARAESDPDRWWLVTLDLHFD